MFLPPMATNEASPVLVLADDREAASPVPAALAQLPGVAVQFRRLAVGDYLVDGRCVFERKTVVDFANSVADGRLFLQAGKLAGLWEPAAIILEGRAGDLAGTQMRREALQGAMVSLGLIFHLPVLRAQDPAETARLMTYAAQQMRRHEWSTGFRNTRRPKRKRRIQLRLLQGLPGVGPTRASQLLEKFGSVEAAMTASLEELEKVEGIGSKTAAAIRDVLQESPLPYRSSVA
ncbi:MAG TPA: ERCC4 domain-containing protein [Verrucomicrobiae bacterium]